MDDFMKRLQNWLDKPFKQDGNVVDWILFLGFALVVAFFWTRILKQIRE